MLHATLKETSAERMTISSTCSIAEDYQNTENSY